MFFSSLFLPKIIVTVHGFAVPVTSSALLLVHYARESRGLLLRSLMITIFYFN